MIKKTRRSKITGRYIKKSVDGTKVTRAIVMFGIAVLMAFQIGDWISEQYIKIAYPEIHSPIPQGYSFDVQAHEEVKLSPMPSMTPTPTVEPEIAPTEAVVEYIKSKSWPIEEALAVAKCESGYYEKAHGDLHLTPSSYGVFQIRAFAGRPSPDDLFNFKKNIDYAYDMYKVQGWNPWSCKRVLSIEK